MGAFINRKFILFEHIIFSIQLVNWLQYAEDHSEKVHLIGHHPPRSCMASFGWNFYKIVNR